MARLLTWFFNSCKNIRITITVTLSPTLASDPSGKRSFTGMPSCPPVIRAEELPETKVAFGSCKSRCFTATKSLCGWCLLEPFYLFPAYPVARRSTMESCCKKKRSFSVCFKSDFTECQLVVILRKTAITHSLFIFHTVTDTIFFILSCFQPGKWVTSSLGKKPFCTSDLPPLLFSVSQLYCMLFEMDWRHRNIQDEDMP